MEEFIIMDTTEILARLSEIREEQDSIANHIDDCDDEIELDHLYGELRELSAEYVSLHTIYEKKKAKERKYQLWKCLGKKLYINFCILHEYFLMPNILGSSILDTLYPPVVASIQVTFVVDFHFRQ